MEYESFTPEGDLFIEDHALGEYLQNKSLKLTKKEEAKLENFKLWSKDGSIYTAVNDTCSELPPDLYEINSIPRVGIVFNATNYKIEDLVRFTDSKIDEVINEIEKFWTKRELFSEFGIPYKRGILLYGPPGGGKSCTIKFIIKDILIVVALQSIFSIQNFCSRFENVEKDSAPYTSCCNYGGS
ncbi:MAG: hypothetical protein HC877_23835 [Thioploca sp.]|nr:hypothetical protein [Thioploca sp.]